MQKKQQKIIATDGSYEARDALMKEGFRFYSKGKQKAWVMEGDESLFLSFKQKYPSVKFILK